MPSRAQTQRRKKNVPLPAFAGSVAKRFPRIWDAYAKLGEEVAGAGPLNERERRLVKLALAVGAGTEGGTHSHTRQGLAEGRTADDIRQVALLAITTTGWPASIAALSWIDDVLPRQG